MLSIRRYPQQHRCPCLRTVALHTQTESSENSQGKSLTPLKPLLTRERRQSFFFCAQQQLWKCIENQHYMGAAAAKENIDALTVVVARADSNISRTMTAHRVVYQGPQAKRATNRERPFCIFASKKRNIKKTIVTRSDFAATCTLQLRWRNEK